MPILEPRFGGPGQERRDVVRHLRHGRGHTVGESHGVVAKRRRHGDLMSREELVVVHPGEQVEVRWRLFVPGKNTVDVIGPARARLNNQRLIGRQRAVIRSARRLVVWERPRDRVGGPARPLVHLTLVVRSVRDLIAGGYRLYLVLAVTDVREVTEVEMLDRMTDRANLLVTLEAALQRRPVVSAEHPVKGPLLTRQLWALIGGPGDDRWREHKAAKHRYS